MTASLNPWKTVWWEPRRTIRYLTAYRIDRWMLALAMMAGAVRTLFRLKDPGFAGLLVNPLLGAFGGILSMYVTALLLRWVGTWFGGRARTWDIARAWAWSNVPIVPVFALLLLIRIGLATALITDSEDLLNPFRLESVVWGLVALGIVALHLWSLVIFVVMLSEVQQWPLSRTLASLLTPILILSILVIMVLLVIEAGK
jgi:hypothetical protein